MKLANRKTRLVFETAAEVREWGTRSTRRVPVYRPITIEAHPSYCVFRLKGTRQGYAASYQQLYDCAVKMHVEQQRREAKTKKGKP
jgi:hypothetical protein